MFFVFLVLMWCLKVLCCLHVILHIKLMEILNVLPKLIPGGVECIRKSSETRF